ncbi:MAG: ABC-2 transporter permease [Lachnospiraceae bacterium]
MKGLLYKEFFLGRKNYLAFLVLFFAFALLGALVCLSMICGNLKSLPVQEPESVQVLAGIFTYVPYALALLAVFSGSQSVYSDYASGFMKFSYTLPVKAVKSVGARYLTGMIVLCTGVLLGIANAGIISTLTEIPLQAEAFKNMLVIFFLVAVLFAGELPLALKFKSSKAVSGIAVCFIVSVYLVAGGLFINGMNHFEVSPGEDAESLYLQTVLHKYAEIRDILLPFLPVVLLAILGISFFTSVKIYKRREK